MKRKQALTLCGIIFTTLLFAQNTINVDKVYTKTIDLVNPICLDSTNLKGEKFETKALMKAPLFDKQLNFADELTSGTGGYIFLPKATTNAKLYLLSFQYTTNRYSKVTLKIKAPSMVELSINGKDLIAKSSIQDSLVSAKILEKEYSSVPQTNTVLVKYLSLPTNKATEAVKISIELAKDDSLTALKVDPTGKCILTINDILEGTRIISSRISPNGQYALLSYKSVAKGGESSYSSELYELKTRKRIKLNQQMIGWTPLTNKLFYEEKGESGLQLVSLDPADMSTTILAENVPTASFYFTPNEKFLILNEKEVAEKKKGDLKDLKYMKSPEDRQAGYNDRYFIYKYDLSNGLKQRLTYGKHSTIINGISSDSRYLMFSTQDERLTERPFSVSSMYKLDLQTMALDTLWSKEDYVNTAVFSPNGKEVLITGGPEAFNGIGANVKKGETPNSFDTQAFIMNLSTKKIEPITRNFDPSVDDFYWNKSDGLIYLVTTDHDYKHVYTYNTSSKTFKLLNFNEDIIRKLSLADTKNVAVYLGSSVSNSTRAYAVDLSNTKSSLIADPFEARLSKIELGEVKDWNFTSLDGTTIEGRYYLPPDFDSSKKYPLIIYYYGGTTPTQRAFEGSYPLHMYASLGYIVYTLQPSGAIGFGQEFSARHVNTWGKQSADDIIEGTKKFAKEHSFVDASKIGCLGASYGGFMTMYLQTRTDIFAAAVAHAGISELSSYWGGGNWGYTYSTAASANSYPWNNKDLYVNQSPLFSADKVKTPILLLHGTADTNVPPLESMQMYLALKILGKPVALIQVVGENHHIVDYNKRIEWNYSIYAWFDKWLKNDPTWWKVCTQKVKKNKKKKL